eukprot:384232_1
MLPHHNSSSEIMTKQNDELQNQLSSKVRQLVVASRNLRRIIIQDKSNWGKMEPMFGSASDILSQAMKKFDVMKQTGGINVILYLAIFMFFVFMILYWMLSS